MIAEQKKELRSLNYHVDRCISFGLLNHVKLNVKSVEEIKQRKAEEKKKQELQNKHSSDESSQDEGPIEKEAEAPKAVPDSWTALHIFEGHPVRAYIDADERIGSVKFVLRGNVPKDLIIYISEDQKHVTEKNATWTFANQRRVFSIFPSDQANLNSKKG